MDKMVMEELHMDNTKVKLIGKGELHLVMTDANGAVVQEETTTNLIVDTGLALTAAILSGESVDPLSHIAVGDDDTAVNANQTALVGTELARVAPTITRTNNSVAFAAAFGAGVGTGTIKETGLFNAEADGTMFSRALTGTYVKAADYSLGITWTVTWSVA